MIDFDLYLISDRARTAGKPLLKVIQATLEGGVRTIQLREKDLGTRDLLDLASSLKDLCREYDAHILLNERVDLAMALGLDGVHLPEQGFPVADARRLLGPDAIIGASTHSLEKAFKAQNDGADFVTLGPVYSTPSKVKYGQPLGTEILSRAATELSIPVFALGGIKQANLHQVAKTGVHGIAMISALLEDRDPRAAAQNLIKKWRELKK